MNAGEDVDKEPPDIEAAGYATLRNSEAFGDFEICTGSYLMQQQDSLQMFHFPNPVLCVGGILQASFLAHYIAFAASCIAGWLSVLQQ